MLLGSPTHSGPLLPSPLRAAGWSCREVATGGAQRAFEIMEPAEGVGILPAFALLSDASVLGGWRLMAAGEKWWPFGSGTLGECLNLLEETFLRTPEMEEEHDEAV